MLAHVVLASLVQSYAPSVSVFVLASVKNDLFLFIFLSWDGRLLEIDALGILMLDSTCVLCWACAYVRYVRTRKTH